MKQRATVKSDWPRLYSPTAALKAGDLIEATTREDGQIIKATLWRGGRPYTDAEYQTVESAEIRAALIQYGKPDETDPSSYIDTAIRGRLDDLALIVRTRDAGEAPDDEALEALGFSLDGDAVEEAERLLDEYPLSVESTTTFEVVIGTGGPDDRFLFECSVYPRAEQRPGEGDYTIYEIDRVLYRYSWEGSAERVLTGEDRKTAEELARRVVPELAE